MAPETLPQVHRDTIIEIIRHVCDKDRYTKAIQELNSTINGYVTAGQDAKLDTTVGHFMTMRDLYEVGDWQKNPVLSVSVHNSFLQSIFQQLLQDAIGLEAAAMLAIMYGGDIAEICEVVVVPFIVDIVKDPTFAEATSVGRLDDEAANRLIEKTFEFLTEATEALQELKRDTATPPSATLH